MNYIVSQPFAKGHKDGRSSLRGKFQACGQHPTVRPFTKWLLWAQAALP
ncbi:hypothetical protein [Phocaeicola fibrisolvens]|nr:hypothetical protein [Phocaeicola fibrisolvens]MCU6776935.1 hypothetical protein [Phocaeicola fibrisolvens]